jgi:DNA-binding response OmpR family regulator
MNKRKKILIVDDEANFLSLLKITLESTGDYEVQTLMDGREILTRTKEFRPDVILLDILMPKMDGVEVCKILNADPDVNRIPILTLSALDTDTDKLMMYKLGVVDFLVKPIEKDTLILRIEKALRNK